MTDPTDDPDRSVLHSKTTRRGLLTAGGTSVAALAIAAAGSDAGDALLGGAMVDDPGHIAGNLYGGPETDVSQEPYEYEPKVNRTFLARDTGNVWMADGDQWNNIGRGVPESPAPPSHFESVGTDDATITDQLETTTPHTVYVRTAGDDTNDGYSESDAVATFERALLQVANLATKRNSGADFPTHVIDLEAGATFDVPERLDYTAPWVGLLRVTTSDGATPATLSAGAGLSKTMVFRRCAVEFRNIHTEASDTTNRPQSIIEIDSARFSTRDDCLIKGAADRNLRVDHQSYALIRSGTTIRGRGQNNNGKGVWVHDASKVDMFGTIEQAQRGIYGTRGGKWAVESGTIQDCDVAMEAGDTAVGKMVGGTISNCNTGFKVTNNGFLKYDGNQTFSAVGTLRDLAGAAGYIYDSGNDILYGGVGGQIRWMNTAGEYVRRDLSSKTKFEKPADFGGLPNQGVDTGGATPTDTTTPAGWEQVTGEDGSTYYRGLYQ